MVNVGTGHELSVNELYRMLTKFTPNGLEAMYAPPKSGEQRRSAIDPSLAKRILDWEPLVPVEKGLGETWDWFKDQSGSI